MTLRASLILDYRGARDKRRSLTDREHAGWLLWYHRYATAEELLRKDKVRQIPPRHWESVRELLGRVQQEEEEMAIKDPEKEPRPS
jgi:hypothetical protein